MRLQTEVLIVAGLILLVSIAVFIRRKTPRKLKTIQFSQSWKELQSFCKDKATWPQALIEADKLLDEALKKRKFKGKSMGERMVSAQRKLSDNDGIWSAHNLCKRIVTSPATRLKEVNVKSALVAYRQALKDIGALPNGEPKDSK